MQNKNSDHQSASPVIYKAILDPSIFDNAHFWLLVNRNPQCSLLTPYIIEAADQAKFTCVSRIVESGLGESRLHYPPLKNFVYFLCQSTDKNTQKILMNLMENSLFRGWSRHNNSTKLNNFFEQSKTLLNAHELEVLEKTANPDNTYPSYIGHPEFVVPNFRKSQITAHFYLSVLLVAAGVAALVVAFAYLQAAAMVMAGVSTAIIGSAAILGGLALFQINRSKIAAENERIKQETIGWSPKLVSS